MFSADGLSLLDVTPNCKPMSKAPAELNLRGLYSWYLAEEVNRAVLKYKTMFNHPLVGIREV